MYFLTRLLFFVQDSVFLHFIFNALHLLCLHLLLYLCVCVCVAFPEPVSQDVQVGKKDKNCSCD